MSTYDILGIGNALLDTEYRVEDEFLREIEVNKGSMTLIDSQRRRDLLQQVQDYEIEIGAGGSVANSIYAAQGFGCRNFFAGLVADDLVGQMFNRELSNVGMDHLAAATNATDDTGQCMIFVTPDGERSMNTYLGINECFGTDHLVEANILNSKSVFIEGYMANGNTTFKTAERALRIANKANLFTCLTLADVSVIDSHSRELSEFLELGIDLLFCNIEEANRWCESTSIEQTMSRILDSVPAAVITVAEEGCYYVSQTTAPEKISGFPTQAVDSNGAGDVFAGAFLHGLINRWNATECALFANFAAARSVQQMGARLKPFSAYRKVYLDFVAQSS